MHDGHRERMRKRFLTDQSLSGFAEHEALEFLLFYALPRIDTNEIAHRLIDKFGSLANIFEADVRDIAQVKGMGESSAVLLKLVPEIARKYWAQKEGETAVLSGLKRSIDYIRPILFGKAVENVYVFCLSNKYAVKHYECISKGNIDSATIYARDVAGCALRLNSNKIILAHNHPGGDASPSLADINATKTIKNTLTQLGVELVDHIIFAGDNFYSFAAHNKYSKDKNAGEIKAAEYAFTKIFENNNL